MSKQPKQQQQHDDESVRVIYVQFMCNFTFKDITYSQLWYVDKFLFHFINNNFHHMETRN